MNTITNQTISRRTMLRGLGAMVSLPFLDAMTPAIGAPAPERPRLGIVYAPNGMYMPAWTGSTLQPLEAFRNRYTVLTGFGVDAADDMDRVAGPHSLASTAFLTGGAPHRSEGALKARVSLDQQAAKVAEKDSWLPSIELACEEQVGWMDREREYSPAYLNHLSWRSPYTPMPAETSPAGAFQRLFQDGGDLWVKGAMKSSILDRIAPGAASLAGKIGPADRGRLSDFLTNLRELEQRTQTARDLSKRDLAFLMMDIAALAFQTSATRVATIMLGREKSRCTFPELNIGETHHQLSHKFRDEETIAKLRAIDRYHAEMFAHFVGKLDSMKTASGTVLDSSILLYGSGLSDGATHRHDGLPLVMAGGGYKVPAEMANADGNKKLSSLHDAIARRLSCGSRES